MNQKTIILIVASLAGLILLSFGYKYFSIQFQKNKELEVINARQKIETDRQKSYKDCVANAEQKRSSDFNLGIDIQTGRFEKIYGITVGNSPIPDNLAGAYNEIVTDQAWKVANETYEEEKNECYKLYK